MRRTLLIGLLAISCSQFITGCNNTETGDMSKESAAKFKGSPMPPGVAEKIAASQAKAAGGAKP